MTKKPPLSDTELMWLGVGMICSAWAYLEYLLAVSIWWWLNLTPEQGHAVTDELDIQRRAFMLRKMAQKRSFSDSELQTINDVVDGIEKTIGDRNLVVHGIWSKIPNTNKITLEVHRSKYRHDPQTMTPGRFGDIHIAIDDIITPFAEMLERKQIIQNGTEPSQDKSRAQSG